MGLKRRAERGESEGFVENLRGQVRGGRAYGLGAILVALFREPRYVALEGGDAIPHAEHQGFAHYCYENYAIPA